MVKSLTAICICVFLLTGLGIFEWAFVQNEFSSFEAELNTLYDKAEREEAGIEDAKAVRVSWEERKSRLHVWIPHNDIARVDDYLSEVVKLVGEKEFALALGKLEVLRNLCTTVPGTYSPLLENVL